MRRFFWAMILTLLWPGFAEAASVYGYGHDWRAFDTEHFEIVYHEGAEFIARKTGIVAEDIYPVLTSLFHWEPRTRIRIVISDILDDTNGSSSLQPWNTTRIYAALPHSEDRLDDYDDWIRAILTHELTHAIHLDSARGIPLGMRYVFGRYLFLHHYQPIFLVEGLATWSETEHTTKGRNRSTVSDMMLRAAVIEDEFPALDEASNWTREWPSGATPYIFGGMFHKFIADRYGPESLGDYSYKHAGQLWPFWFNRNARLIFGKPMRTLWKDFERDATERYTRQVGEIEAAGLTPTRPLAKPGRMHRRPVWLDNDRVMVEERHPRRANRLAVFPADGGSSRTFTTVTMTGGAALLTDGRVVYAQIDEHDPFSQWYDLFIADKGGRERQLTRGQRLRDPAAGPEGRLYAVAQEMGRTKIVEVDPKSGVVRELFGYDRFPFFTQIGPPAVSPDGKTLAFSIWHDDGNRDLFLYHVAEDRFQRVTAHPTREVEPVYSADGRTLFFASDRTGVYNIYALDLEQGRLFQVTNVLTGVFEPAPSPDGRRLALISYSADGYDVHVMDLDPASWREVGLDPIPEDAVLSGPISRAVDSRAEAFEPEVKPYSVVPTIFPSYWQPVFSYSVIAGNPVSRLGVSTSGTDSIYRHNWTAAFVYGFEHEFPNVFLTYGYDGFMPSLRASFSRSSLDWGNIAEDETGDTFEVLQDRIAGAVGATFALTDHWAVFTNYVVQNLKNHVGLEHPTNVIPDEGFLAGPRFGAIYSDVESYAMSISAENGPVVYLTGAIDDHIFGSEYDVLTGVVSATQYVSLPFYNNVWRFDLKAGAVQGDKRYRGGFRVGGFVQQDLTAQTSDNRFALRGFLPGSLVGERAVVGSFDWRTPIWYQQRGLGSWPVFFSTLSGSAFVTAAKTWFDELYLRDPGEIYEAYGFELSQSLGLAYYSGITLRFIYAYAPDRNEPASYYIGTGTDLF